MEKLQKIQTEEHSGKMVLLMEKSKKHLAIEDVVSLRFIPAPWFALHKVSYTQRTNFVLNLVLLTFICGIVTLIVGPLSTVLPALLLYALIFLVGLALLIASPKKSTSLEIISKDQSIKMKDLTNNHITELYYKLKPIVLSKINNATLIMETKVIRNFALNVSSFVVSFLALVVFYKMKIGLTPLILFFFYCLLLCGSLAFNSRYNPKIQVALNSKGLKFIEFKGKYEGREHLIEADMIERLSFDKSHVIGLVRKSRKSIVTNTENKEVIPHYNRIDLHFFHQAYLPMKKYRELAPFFMHWLNEEISSRQRNLS